MICKPWSLNFLLLSYRLHTSFKILDAFLSQVLYFIEVHYCECVKFVKDVSIACLNDMKSFCVKCEKLRSVGETLDCELSNLSCISLNQIFSGRDKVYKPYTVSFLNRNINCLVSSLYFLNKARNSKIAEVNLWTNLSFLVDVLVFSKYLRL